MYVLQVKGKAGTNKREYTPSKISVRKDHHIGRAVNLWSLQPEQHAVPPIAQAYFPLIMANGFNWKM